MSHYTNYILLQAVANENFFCILFYMYYHIGLHNTKGQVQKALKL